jgi:ribosomal protein S18 acetylase RimI-like enzyme
MNTALQYRLNHAGLAQIAAHLLQCEADFVPPLSNRVDIPVYAQKVATKAARFEAWGNNVLVGLVAMYSDDQATHRAYITSVSVLRVWKRRGIGERLMRDSMAHARQAGMVKVSLEVGNGNGAAIRLYENLGFTACAADDLRTVMEIDLTSEGSS